MKISYTWLKDFLKTNCNLEEITSSLTEIGLEVESNDKFENIKGSLKGVVIGQVLSVEPHPNADKLKCTKVKISESETLSIVCGAPNVSVNQKVAVATIGTELTVNNQSFTISKSKIRGEESFGMLCSEVELNIGTDNSGLKIFDDSIEIGTKIADLYDISEDFCIEIGLTPNRSDAMSHFGVARDVFAALSFKKQNVEFIDCKTDSITSEVKDKTFSVEIENPELCSRYSAVYLTDIKINDSPTWLKNRLKCIGLEPINNVVDITNYVLHHLGQPLHAFDTEKISNQQVKIGTCGKGTRFITLDGNERTLNGEELMIKDGENNPLCIAGVFGGKLSGVSQTTTSILLESAYFNPVSVRKTAKNHQLNTDSSFRFERGCDPNLTVKALEFAVDLLKKYAGASVSQALIDEYPKLIENKTVILRYHKIDKILGHKIHREEIKKIIQLLKIDILSDYNETLELSIPPYRADVEREIDVIEEILRIYGYNTIELPEKISFSHIKTEENHALIYENKVSNLLINNGFFECLHNSLVPYDEKIEDKVVLLNPLSNDLSMLRNHLYGGMLETIAFNLNRKQTSIKLFEFGKSYHKINNEYVENQLLTIILCGKTSDDNWVTPANETSFYELRGTVEQVLSLFGIDEVQEEFSNEEHFNESIRFSKNGKNLAILGSLDKKYTKSKDINKTVFAATIDFQNVLNQRNTNKKFKEIAKFPVSRRDLSLILDKKITYQELKLQAFKSEQKILKKIGLFDVYEGDKIPNDKKSYAICFYLQDENKTLIDSKIDASMSKILKDLQEKYQVELRN
jgi:phenylalanyl-tRNA synthetase beta chain